MRRRSGAVNDVTRRTEGAARGTSGRTHPGPLPSRAAASASSDRRLATSLSGSASVSAWSGTTAVFWSTTRTRPKNATAKTRRCCEAEMQCAAQSRTEGRKKGIAAPRGITFAISGSRPDANHTAGIYRESAASLGSASRQLSSAGGSFGPSVRRRMIRRASGSLISRCRGTGWDTPVAGLRYQSCLPPCRTKMHPLASIDLIRSTRSWHH
jgi:hypothetical protein